MQYQYRSVSFPNEKRHRQERMIFSIVSFVIGAIVGGVVGVFIFIRITGGSAAPSQAISAPELSLADFSTPTAVEDTQEVIEVNNEVSPTAESEVANVQASSSSLPPQLYRIVPAESEARFSVYETFPEGTAIGRTSEIAGDFIIDFANPSNSQLGTIRINLRTLATDDPDRDQSIRCCVLLTARPENEFTDFVPLSISGLPEQVDIGQIVNFQVTGNITLRGITAPITFDVMLTILSEDEISGLASATVLRSDFGILNDADNGFDYHGVAEAVNLEFAFVARPVQ
ncbi:MAG: hypothetical protein DWQ07_18675 [Chloroflexi bacterium]|nr:MAG: hypothetical protein DWQ07_18675 [Chloroflexota bacterium]MBL1194957.1 hypothetical protein [Chloroflexota bacterium]NOH12247.1 YceI family protein [Chloroflexota bacterium]